MHHHRRRKKRPNYGSIEVSRGENGFGFTISGQQPCILSCIVPNSPADMAGLRSGDFLISVNGLNVSKLPHESVVQLIGSSVGTIRLAIAENYYSDSSDDDGPNNQIQQRARPKYPHHKLKINRNIHNRLSLDAKKVNTRVNEPKPSTSFADQNSNHSSDSVNKATNAAASPKDDFSLEACRTQRSLEYRTIVFNVIVGYLGTIEMPVQIATSSKLQTVRSCIRKMRQEKRNPTMVLMTILPHCLTLKNNLNVMLAKYPNSRLSFVSGNSENDKRFFGLVTSAMYSDDMMYENGQSGDSNVIISNSCHVFVVDTKLTEHSAHLQKAEEFRITCTKDPISDLCLEFPNNSEYVVNLIRSMYTLKSVYPNENERPRVARQLNMNEPPRRIYGADEAVGVVANSPQPSNHSEITTTSSNSDSGIGFHNDCANISDRILVVDFPGLQNRQIASIRGKPLLPNARPVAIINDHSLLNIRGEEDISESSQPPAVNLRSKSKSMDLINNSSPSKFNSRQNRAIFASNIPGCSKDIRSPSQLHRKYDYEEIVNASPGRSSHLFQERPVDVPHNFKFESPYNLRSSQLAARSCDDVMMAYRSGVSKQKNGHIQLSIDDVNLLGDAPKPPNKSKDDYVFLPPKPVRKSKKPSSYKHLKLSPSSKCQSKSVTASPNVLRLCRPVSASVENLLSNKQCQEKSDYESIWGSMQDLRRAAMDSRTVSTYMEGTYSEPDLTVSFYFSNNFNKHKQAKGVHAYFYFNSPCSLSRLT